METPFIYGKLAVGENFTDREAERSRLIMNFRSGTNTILISPRRWGKSSLVLNAASELKIKDKSLMIAFIDLFNIRNEEEFYKALAESVIRVTSSRIEEALSNVRQFMKQWVPRISLSPDAHQEFSLGLNWSEVKKEPDEILDLAEKIAVSKKIKLVICIDEFQNIAFFEDPLAFQKKLRAHWQRHQSVSYCLYGSKRHMLMDVFTSPSMPFYKFGDLVFLSKIAVNYWISFINERFTATGKTISASQAEEIAILAEGHPYYVQQLAQQIWLRTDADVNDKTITEAMDGLVLQMSLLFQGMTENLTTPQVNFLRMLADGETRYSTGANIIKYRLGSSANVIRIKKSLMTKEIIDEEGNGVIMLDPLYSYWLKNYYFTEPQTI
jgi:hypothetical protein